MSYQGHYSGHVLEFIAILCHSLSAKCSYKLQNGSLVMVTWVLSWLDHSGLIALDGNDHHLWAHCWIPLVHVCIPTHVNVLLRVMYVVHECTNGSNSIAEYVISLYCPSLAPFTCAYCSSLVAPKLLTVVQYTPSLCCLCEFTMGPSYLKTQH